MTRLAILALAALAACGGDPAGAAATALDLGAPTAVVVDAAGGCFVATIWADGAAGILRLAADGSVAGRFAGGAAGKLVAPKGLAHHGGVLFVADGTRVVKLDARDGRWLGAVPVPGAVGLWDVAAAADGSLWLADPGLGADDQPVQPGSLFWLPAGGAVVERLATDDCGRPTALVAQPTGVYAVTFDGDFLLVDRRARVERLGKAPASELTGLCRVAPGRWLAGSRRSGSLYQFDLRGGAPQAVPDLRLEQPGDFDVDAGRGQLLVPTRGPLRLVRHPVPESR